ncbi:hypothetical protein AM1BK_32750 [Neobacillus kokaensis]|uniref:Lycopene cyclase domain-containing protein n=2 Tax=Neobacillus kokaensis TaxID=2759023 RepID=A0ABQ3N891_9BACI|nr:hypothetical protein AM1BK_32750 [Neobacillus kokaensis]
MGLNGSGVGGDYWILLIFVFLMISVVFLGWRGIRVPFRFVLVIWFLLLTVESGSWFFSAESVHFKGDTLGFDVPFGKIIFPFDLLFLILSIVWIIRDSRNNFRFTLPSMKKINRILLILFFCLFPFQLLLFRILDYSVIFDEIGVFLTIFQWILLNLSFYPWKSSKKNKITL